MSKELDRRLGSFGQIAPPDTLAGYRTGDPIDTPKPIVSTTILEVQQIHASTALGGNHWVKSIEAVFL